MVANAPVALEEITTEVDRYIGMPGQALAYKVGQREILRLRADARGQLGDRFSIDGFHDAGVGAPCPTAAFHAAVLAAATISLPVLGERVGNWVTATS